MSNKLSEKISSKVQGPTLEKEKVSKVPASESIKHKGVATGWGGMQHSSYAATDGSSQKEHSSFLGKTPKYIDANKATDCGLLYKGKKSGK